MNTRFSPQSSFLKIVSLLFLVISLTSCEKDPDPVIVSSFEPTSGDYESEITISGSHFAADITNNTVKFGSKTAEIISGTATELVVAVPIGAVTSKITVEADGQSVTFKEDFTVTAGSWSRMADLNKVVDGNSLFFTIGGNAYVHQRWYTSDGRFVPASFWTYSPTANSWVQKKELDINQDAITANFWGTSEKGYILQYQKLWEYNPTTNLWVQKGTLPPALNTNNVVGVFYVNSVNRAIAVLSNGTWFSHDPVNDVWTAFQSSSFAAEVTAAAAGNWTVQGTVNKGFLMKGKTVWEFDPVNYLWTQLPSFPNQRDYSFGINNELYVGYAGDDYENNLWVYKKDQNKWVRKANLMGSRYWPIYFTVNNRGYMGLGVKNPEGYYTYDFNEYKP